MSCHFAWSFPFGGGEGVSFGSQAVGTAICVEALLTH